MLIFTRELTRCSMFYYLNPEQIPISATYIPSVFGSCIESLVFLYRPIQDPPVAQLIDVVRGKNLIT